MRLLHFPRRRLSVAASFPAITLVVLLLLSSSCGWCATASELRESGWVEQVARFFSFKDPSVRYALAGSVLLGVCCGMMGSFLVVRKLALMGDALSHAVLPGVALGFLWGMTRDPVAIFVGALAAGLLGAVVVQALRNTTKHKEDAALGFVLASFFGLGICLFTMIQNDPEGNMGGLNHFMFGQAAAMGEAEVILLAIVTALVVGTVGWLYKEFAVASFDEGFARALGLPVRALHYGLMLLLAFAIVASLQAVGVVLVSAMLIIPAAAAYLLTDRLHRMLALAALFGCLAGAAGCFFSFIGRNLPTGPFMVLGCSAVFVLALFFAPRHGIATRWWGRLSRAARVGRENTLKSVYHILEREEFARESVSLRELAEARRETWEEAQRRARALSESGLGTLRGEEVSFTPAGWQRACEIVRNHRLWELYLTTAAHVPADHVHEDAEKIEHVLGEETVRMLERRLDYARRDPHGKLIPGLQDIHSQKVRVGEPHAAGYSGGRGLSHP